LKARRAEGDNEVNARIALEGAHQPKSSSRVIAPSENNNIFLKLGPHQVKLLTIYVLRATRSDISISLLAILIVDEKLCHGIEHLLLRNFAPSSITF
jgi:hypothetical protein